MIPSLFGAYIPVAATKSYNDVLPSLNFAYDVTRRWWCALPPRR